MNDTIPVFDLKRQQQGLKAETLAALERVYDSGQFVLGEEVERFEQEFADYCEAPRAVAVSSGTSALHLALVAAGIGPGDEVITVPFTFVATVATVLYAGATPVLVDIEEKGYCLDVDRLEAAITPRTRAILPVHLYGHPVDLDPILELAREHDLVVIEDAAQAHGARYKGARAGSLGHYGCFSFYPSKNLGATGEGGAVLCRDESAATLVRQLRDWGQSAKYVHALPGFNYRMDGFQAAGLRIKLSRLESWVRKRQEMARRYDELLADAELVRPAVAPHAEHAYHLYVVRVRDRPRVQEELQRAGIGTAIHYSTPVHLQPAYRSLGYGEGDFPVAETVAGEVLSIPFFPELRDDELKRVAAELRRVTGACR